MTRADIVIIGGGIVGVSIAYQLAIHGEVRLDLEVDFPVLPLSG